VTAIPEPAALPPELAELDTRFEIAYTDIPLSSGAVHLMHPKDYDDLISEEDFGRDDRLPYWADIWPSSRALANSLPGLAPIPCTVLEMGCGLGLVTIAALRGGHTVLATDYYLDAMLFTRRNSLVASGRDPATLMADWRNWPDDAGRFDLVLASDVLYERSYAELLAAIISGSLAPRGRALIADPGRVAHGDFVQACEDRGLKVEERLKVPHDDGAIHQVITIHEITAPA
jgi:predicted nicotinamide N-methyase